MKTKKGFTIIEVVLVLAIAGLIFLMVFIALPALQRSQRDTQRREDVSRVVTALTQYQANNGGEIPSQGTKYATTFSGCSASATNGVNASLETLKEGSGSCRFIAGYLNPSDATKNEFVDPSGTPYTMAISGKVTTNISEQIAKFRDQGGTNLNQTNYPVASTIFVFTSAKCDGDSPEYVANNTRNFAVLLKLEGSGRVCIDNS